MTVRSNEVYQYKGRNVKVGKVNGFYAKAREPHGAYFNVQTNSLRPSRMTLKQFSQAD